MHLFRNNIDLTPGKSTGRTPTIGKNELKIIHKMVSNKPDQMRLIFQSANLV